MTPYELLLNSLESTRKTYSYQGRLSDKEIDNLTGRIEGTLTIIHRTIDDTTDIIINWN